MSTTPVRQQPRDMSAMCGKADDDGPPLSGWCCGAMDAAEEDDQNESAESKSDTNSLKSEGTRRAALAKSSHIVRYPPIVFSPVDESKLTHAKQRSIADRSTAESTFVDDNDEDLYMVLAGIIGSSQLAANAAAFGDKIVLSMGYNKGERSVGYKTFGSEQTSSTTDTSDPNATKTTPNEDADDNSSMDSTITQPVPKWVAVSQEGDESKPAKNENIEIKPKHRNKLTKFLFKRVKKSAFVPSPSADTSTAASAMSSIGM